MNSLRGIAGARFESYQAGAGGNPSVAGRSAFGLVGAAGHDEIVSDEIVMDENLAIEVVRAVSD